MSVAKWSIRSHGGCYSGSSCWQGECGKEAERQQGLSQRCDRDRQEHHQVPTQARVSYKPDGGKTVQRSAGTFDTPEEAALQMAAYFTRRSLLKALTLGIERRFTLSTSEARPFPCFRHGSVSTRASTVKRGLIETVIYRNRAFVFPDFGIETVLTPPPRATETTVT